MKRIVVLGCLAIAIVSQACMPHLPKKGRDLAISVLCDFPTDSGVNMCRKVDIIDVVIPNDFEMQKDGKLKNWCIELNFVDYTGESGFACVWLVGPSEHGEFLLKKGPIFGERCAEVN